MSLWSWVRALTEAKEKGKGHAPIACEWDHPSSEWARGWGPYKLPLVESAYNNSYQASIRMAPYEALYGRSCRSPLCWTEVGKSSITGPDLIRDTSEKVSLIR